MLSTTIKTFPLQDIDKSNFPPLNPQQEQIWDVGSQRLITLKSWPYFSAFPSINVLNVLQSKSEIALDNFRFLTIPETFKSSKTIVWFSRIISVDNLCRKSILVSFSLAWNLAIFSLAFSYPLEPLVFLDNDLLSFRYFEHSFL